MRLFHNACILDGRGRFEPGALLVSGGRISGVVSSAGTRELLGRDGVECVDLHGGHVLPGFVDAHIHILALASNQLRCDLSAVRSAAELLDVLGAFAVRHAAQSVVGVDWDQSRWDDPTPPSRRDLDAIDATRAVFARRVCGHTGVANGALLGALGAPSPFVDQATGVITEDAVWEANRLTAPAPEAVAGAFPAALAGLHALGVTAVHDIVTPGGIDAYVDGLSSAPPGLHVDALVVGDVDQLEAVRSAAAGLARLRVAGVKHFADGSLGARTAALRDPYADAPGCGDLLLDESDLCAAYRRAAEAGVVCAVHAIGDRAVAAAVSAFDGAGREATVRIEHAEVLDDALIDAIAGRAIPLVVQPNFIRNWGGDGGLYHQRLGARRWAMTNPLATLEARGVELAYSSDGMPPGPLFGIGGAVHHPVPGQSVSSVTAVARYTAAPCALAGHRRAAGRLEEGCEADFVVLSGDPLVADPDTLAVGATVVAGTVVFEAGST